MLNDLLKGQIEDCIQDLSQPLWFPNLTRQLAEAGWESLKSEFGLEPANYGTSRILANEIDATILTFPCATLPFSIELLPKDIALKFWNSQIDFYNDKELSELTVLDCLGEAVDLIRKVPSLWDTVSELVKSLHLINPVDEFFDVSFSEPLLPFSIFISVPKGRIDFDNLRVAEAIVHEAMHLQLSLNEGIVPLVRSNAQKFYSPWRDEYRNSTGIFHALYVFRVIESFYGDLLIKHPALMHSVFIKTRRNEILLEIDSVKKFDRSLELTDCGANFAKRLLDVTLPLTSEVSQ